MEYWEEVTGEDGAVYFYNHTDQEYHTSLPAYEDDVETAVHTDQEYNASIPPYGDAETAKHADHEYSTTLPADSEGANTTIKKAPTHSAGDHEARLTLTQAPETHESVMERWENQMWDGIDGEVFVPWKEEDPGDMRASPNEIGLGGDLPQGETGKTCHPPRS